ncbi:MAG: hypothetical protein KAT86_01585, partial [Candidatus Latescibacteria bacterium]|nr:hypothetical protein [Candidatus Latescibacterota bacterium]
SGAPSSLPGVKQTPFCDDAGWYSGHLVNWMTSEYPCGYVTPEDAERIIKGFKEMGHSVIIRGGMHYRYNHQELYDHYAEQTRIVPEIAHKYGMKVVEHMEMVVVTLTGYERLGTPGHCDMLLSDARNGKMTPWFCINNPDLRKMLTDYLVEYQRQTNVDGYMIDEMSIYGQYNCGCRHCRRRFKED